MKQWRRAANGSSSASLSKRTIYYQCRLHKSHPFAVRHCTMGNHYPCKHTTCTQHAHRMHTTCTTTCITVLTSLFHTPRYLPKVYICTQHGGSKRALCEPVGRDNSSRMEGPQSGATPLGNLTTRLLAPENRHTLRPCKGTPELSSYTPVQEGLGPVLAKSGSAVDVKQCAIQDEGGGTQSFFWGECTAVLELRAGFQHHMEQRCSVSSLSLTCYR